MYIVNVHAIRVKSATTIVLYQEEHEAVCIDENILMLRYREYADAIYFDGAKLNIIDKCGDIYVLGAVGAMPIEIQLSPFRIQRERYRYPVFNDNNTNITNGKLIKYKGVPAGYLRYILQNRGVWVLNVYMIDPFVLYSLHSDIAANDEIKSIEGATVNFASVKFPDMLEMPIDRALYKQKVTINGKMIEMQKPFETGKGFKIGDWIILQRIIYNVIHIGGLLAFEIIVSPYELKYSYRDIIFADGQPIAHIDKLINANKITLMKEEVRFIQKEIDNPFKGLTYTIVNIEG